MNLCQRCKLDAENIVHGHLSMSVVPDEKCETWAHKELNNIRLGYRVENSIRWLRRGKEWEVVEAPFIQEILGHYGKKIAGMLEDQKTESIIKSDIRLIMQEVSDAEKDTRVEFNFLDRYMQRHASLVCQAVNVYIYDLNESKKQFYAKLGAEPEMRNLESEIDHAERIKARACGRLPS